MLSFSEFFKIWIGAIFGINFGVIDIGFHLDEILSFDGGNGASA